MTILRRSGSIALIIMFGCSLVDARAREGRWLELSYGKQPVPAHGLRAVRFTPGPLEIHSFGHPSGYESSRPARLSATIWNPRMPRVVAITLSWRLFRDGNLAEPIASGQLREHLFVRPLEIHDSGTVLFDIDMVPGGTHLEVIVEQVAYDYGPRWIRTGDAPKAAPCRRTPQPN